MRADSSQQRAAILEKGFETAKTKYSFGTARIRLDNLRFYDYSYESSQTLIQELEWKRAKEKKIDWLKGVFGLQGCWRLENSINAVINRTKMEQAVAASPKVSSLADLSNMPGVCPPELVFPLTDSVLCFEGSCRVEAAKSRLFGSDRWWAINLYDEDAFPLLKPYLSEQFPNAARYTDGEIYFAIERYSRLSELSDKFNEDRWWSYLTDSRRKYLKMFRGHKTLCQSLNRFETLRALWPDIFIGTLHTLLSLHCDEMILSCWNVIYDFWHDLADGHEDVIDKATVQLLESRCPQMSASDRKYLERNFASSELFGAAETTQRLRMWNYVCGYGFVIPTLRTFFKNLAYLNRVRNVLELVAPDPPEPRDCDVKMTLRQRLESVYPQNQTRVRIQRNDAKFGAAEVPDAFAIVFAEAWLIGMRLWPDVLGVSPQKDRRVAVDRPLVPLSREEALFQLASQTLGLGLDAPKAHAIQQATLQSHHASPNPEETIIELTTADDKYRLPLEYRSGTPFRSSLAADRDALFIERICAKPLPRSEITSLFVCRSLFHMMFQIGEWNIEVREDEVQTLQNQIPDVGRPGDNAVEERPWGQDVDMQEPWNVEPGNVESMWANWFASPPPSQGGSTGFNPVSNLGGGGSYVFFFHPNESEEAVSKSQVLQMAQSYWNDGYALVVQIGNSSQCLEPKDCMRLTPPVRIHVIERDQEKFNQLQRMLGVSADSESEI